MYFISLSTAVSQSSDSTKPRNKNHIYHPSIPKALLHHVTSQTHKHFPRERSLFNIIICHCHVMPVPHRTHFYFHSVCDSLRLSVTFHLTLSFRMCLFPLFFLPLPQMAKEEDVIASDPEKLCLILQKNLLKMKVSDLSLCIHLSPQKRSPTNRKTYNYVIQ